VTACLTCSGPQAYASNQIVAWGAGSFVSSPPDYNNYGQSIVPAKETNAVYAAGGWRHSLALNADGILQGWGDDTLGQTDFVPIETNWLAIGQGEPKKAYSRSPSVTGELEARLPVS
jgi:hypothetical protein